MKKYCIVIQIALKLPVANESMNSYHPSYVVEKSAKFCPQNSIVIIFIWNWGVSLFISSSLMWYVINTLRPRQNGRHFAEDIFKCIFLNENTSVPIKISLKFVPKDPINNIPALVQIKAWCQPGTKPLSEPMMVSSLMHIYVTRSQWVNWYIYGSVESILMSD